MRKLWAFLLKRLYFWAEKHTVKERKDQFLQSDTARRDRIYKFFSEVLPTIDNTFTDQTVVIAGQWNYFVLPSGKFPLFDFSYTRLQLFVHIAGPLSASWEHSSHFGVKREEWEAYQDDLATIKSEMGKIPTESWEGRPKLIVIEWDESTSTAHLYRRVVEALKHVTDF